MAKGQNIKAGLRKAGTEIKAFFLNNKKNALVFLLCLFISAGSWLAIMQNKTYEVWVSYPIQYRNAPPDVELYADLSSTMNLRVRDKAKTVMPYQGRNYRPAVVDFNNSNVVTLNGNTYTISFTNLYEESIKRNFAQTTVVVDYFPKDISFDVVAIDSKRVPVNLHSDIQCRKQYHLSDSIKIDPDSVTLYGRKSVLDTVLCLNTHLLRAQNINDTLEATVGLSLPPRTKSVPNRVTVNIPVEAYTEGSQTLRVNVKNVPSNLRVRTIPEQVKIKYLVGISDYNDISAEDFEVSIDCNNIIKSSSKVEFLELDKCPVQVKNCKLDPVSVEWLIEVVED